MVTLNTDYNLKNIQSIVLYNGTNPSGQRGCNLQLINSEGLIKYESDLDSISEVFRFDGPDIGSVSTFASLISNTNIASLDVSKIVTPSYDEEISAPSNMYGYRNSANYDKVYKMLITGQSGSAGWGTGIYTDDSYIPRAAVHAGAIAVGVTDYVYVKVLPGQSSYTGSTQNGNSTSSYGSWGGSYSFVLDTSTSADISSNTINATLYPESIIRSPYYINYEWTLGAVRQPTYSFDFRTNNNQTRILDQMGTGLGITFINGVTFTEADGAFFSGGSKSTAPYANIDQFSLQSSITIEVYFKFNTSSSMGRIFSSGDGQGSNNFTFGRYSSNNYIGVYTNVSNWDYHSHSSQNKIVNGTYMHVVVTATPSGGSIYTNHGHHYRYSSNNLINPGTRNYYYLARSIYNWDNPNMNMLYFRFWNGVELNSSEVGHLYQNINTRHFYSELSQNNSIVHLNNKNITSGNFTSFTTGNYVDIDISTKSVKFNDIQNIITYNYNTTSSSSSSSSSSSPSTLTVNNGNYPGIELFTITTGISQNSTIDVVSFTFDTTNNYNVENSVSAKYSDNVYILGCQRENHPDSLFIKVIFNVTSEGVLTMYHEIGGWILNTDVTAENLVDSYNNADGWLTTETADRFFFTDLVINITDNGSSVSELDLSNQEQTKIILYDENNIKIIEYKNRLIGDNSYNIYKYKGPDNESGEVSKIQRMKIETTDYTELKLDEVQIIANNENVSANEIFQDQVVESLVATKSVTMPNNYNGNKMNFPQSIFNGSMGSNTKTVSGLTGNLAQFNGTYSITWSSKHTVPYSSNQAHYMFSASNHTNQYGDNYSAQFRYQNDNVPYDSNGNYTGSNYITYQDDNGNSINANGEWFAFEFPAYINFTRVHHIGLDGHVKNFTWIGRDKNGINRLIGTYSMSWNNGWWRSATFNNNYFVNKIYLVVSRKPSAIEYMLVHEIFFDGNYELSPPQIVYPNNSVITASSTKGNDVSSNIVDSKFNTYFLSEKGIGEFIDLSLNTPVNINDIQSILLSSSPINTNPKITKIRYETTANVSIEFNEFQLFTTSNQNQISDISINTYPSSSNENFITDGNINTYFLSEKALGAYVDFSLNDVSFNYNDLQAIMFYNYGNSGNDLSNQQSTKLILYDDSNIPVIQYSNQLVGDISYNIHKFKGPSYNHEQLRNIRLTTTNYTDLDINEIQIWSDQSNILQQGNYTLTIRDSSENTYNSSVFTDGNLNTIYSLEKGLGHFIDISLNNTIDVSKLESVVIYSDISTTQNPKLSKLRFETTKNVPLQFNEIQIWKQNTNILRNRELISYLTINNSSFEEPSLMNYLPTESFIDTNKNFKKIIINNSENSLHISEVQVWKDNSNIAPFGTASITNSKYDPTAAGYSVIVDDYGATSPTNSGWKYFAANERVFIILNNDGSIQVYGTDTDYGASAPTDTFSSIFSASSSHDKNILPNLHVAAKTHPARAFAGVTTSGELRCWGTFKNSDFNGLPTTNDFTGSKIFFTQSAACALKSDGSVATWGRSSEGGTGNDTHPENNPIPTDNGYTAVYASQESFTAIKDDGTVSYWGWASKNYIGSSGAPASVGPNAKITVNNGAFVALKPDGTLLNWGTYVFGGGHSVKPSGTYTKVIATRFAFVGLKTDGSIVEWAVSVTNNPPSGNNYVDIFTVYSENVLAVKSDGTLVGWGGTHPSISSLPTDNDFLNAKFVTHNTHNGSVAALKSNGTVVSWGVIIQPELQQIVDM